MDIAQDLVRKLEFNLLNLSEAQFTPLCNEEKKKSISQIWEMPNILFGQSAEYIKSNGRKKENT